MNDFNHKLLFFLLIVTIIGLALIGMDKPNRYQTRGCLSLSGLTRSARVVRDEKGMPYISASSLDDALLALGFATAQDRLFQMEVIRLVAGGRLSELAGEQALSADRLHRTIGFHRQARKQADILAPEIKHYFNQYIKGINAYITTRSQTYPLEFKLSGLEPRLWTVADSLALLFFMSWNSSSNVKTEITARMLVDKLGPQRARELFPLNINPEDPGQVNKAALFHYSGRDSLGLTAPDLFSEWDQPLELGSNNWVVDSGRSRSGRPILANDPHLDARMLPGPWYPFGLITPEVHCVGVGLAGLPGLVIGRSEHLAFGLTTSYGDMQDLYIEKPDPADETRYLEGSRSLPFKDLTEIIRVRDKSAPGGYREETLKIRLTRRGPVVSNLLPGLITDRIVTLRWAPFETMHSRLGIDCLMTAASVREAYRALADLHILGLNYVLADTEGNIGWTATGKLPVRSQGDGTLPYEVKDNNDNWIGFVPYDKMPHSLNPEKGWVGTCNHKTVASDYPYYYSSYLAPSYRYRRLMELMAEAGPKSVEDHWRFQLDTKNLMAENLAPIMAAALSTTEEVKDLGRLLDEWDFRDDPGKAAPTVFHSIYDRFAFLVFQDELGEEAARQFLGNWYFWEERLQRMAESGESPWFDDVTTLEIKETRDDIFRRAAGQVKGELSTLLGPIVQDWTWGSLHTLDLVSPVRRKGWGKTLLGGGLHPAPGSGETLCRGIYKFNDPFGVTVFAALRMAADLADQDKVLAVLPGGVTGRIFHPHAKDQVKAFMKGRPGYWWFSHQAIREHARSMLVLRPGR